MIFDELANFTNYCIFEEEAALKIAAYLQTLNSDTAPGRYEIDGDDIFAMVSNYDTRSEGEFEAHREYVDIQLLLLGEENIFFAPGTGAIVTKEYTPDIEFFKFTPENAGCAALRVGNFAVFMPGELHMPNMDSANGLFFNIKVVIKVRKERLI